MNLGKILAVCYDAAFWFFVISVFVFPVCMARWRAREKADAAATEKALERCKADTSHLHIYDGA